MNAYIVNIVKDFNPKPYGRYLHPDGEGSGEVFRQKLLVPALAEHKRVHVVLDGYNRYGRSFIDEAFGGLIREEGFTLKELRDSLTFSHSTLDTIEKLIQERLEAAQLAKDDNRT